MKTAYNYNTNTFVANLTFDFCCENPYNEILFHYFGARYYDSDLSIWLSVDPLASKYPSLSPYVYAANNPIKYIDPNGMYIDEWNVNMSTGEKTWVSNKGGDKTQHINLVTNGGTNITSLSMDGNKEVVNNLSNSVKQSGGWSLVGFGAYAGAGATAAAFGARGSIGTFEMFSEKGKEFTFTDVGTNIGYNAGVGAGLMFILGPSDMKGSDLGGWSASISGGAYFFEGSFQTSATRGGIPTFNYLTFSVGLAASMPGGGISTSFTTVTSADKEKTYYGPRPTMFCFAEGTKVYTVGGFKEIQNISVGDSVYSYDLEMNKIIGAIVTQKHISESDSIYKLKIDNEEIYVTGEHPFYIEDKGWITVKDLEIGDKLLSANKEKITLESKEIIIWKSKVYNFEVDGLHNYFITKSKILVHNK